MLGGAVRLGCNVFGRSTPKNRAAKAEMMYIIYCEVSCVHLDNATYIRLETK